MWMLVDVIDFTRYFLVQPSAAEREMMGAEVLQDRVKRVRQARDLNRRFIEQVLEVWASRRVVESISRSCLPGS